MVVRVGKNVRTVCTPRFWLNLFRIQAAQLRNYSFKKAGRAKKKRRILQIISQKRPKKDEKSSKNRQSCKISNGWQFFEGQIQ